MSDEIIAAIIGFAGAFVGAVLGGAFTEKIKQRRDKKDQLIAQAQELIRLFQKVTRPEVKTHEILNEITASSQSIKVIAPTKIGEQIDECVDKMQTMFDDGIIRMKRNNQTEFYGYLGLDATQVFYESIEDLALLVKKYTK